MPSGEMPLLFKLEFVQLWTGLYRKYYGQSTGWMAGFVLFQANLQLGAGRNSVSLTVLNFNVIASWNARYFSSKKIIEMPAPERGPWIELRCLLCDSPAKAMAPICETCVEAVADRKSGRAN